MDFLTRVDARPVFILMILTNSAPLRPMRDVDQFRQVNKLSLFLKAYSLKLKISNLPLTIISKCR